MTRESFPTSETLNKKYHKIAAGIATMALLLSGCGERVSGQDAQQSAAEQQSAATVSETISAEPVDPENNKPAATNQESIYRDEGGSIIHIVQPDNTNYSKGPVIRSVNDLGDGKVEIVTGLCIDNDYYQYTYDANKVTGDLLSSHAWEDTGYDACSTHLGQTGISREYIEKNSTPEITYEKPFMRPIFCMENVSNKTGVQVQTYTFTSPTDLVETNRIVVDFNYDADGNIKPQIALAEGNSCDGHHIVEKQREVYEQLGVL